MIKMIPNTLSLSRIPLGILVCWFAIHNQHLAAFICLVIGLISDGLDGYLAVKLNAKTERGGKLYDPAGDTVLTIGMFTGLVMTGAISLPVIITIVAITVTLWLPIVTAFSQSRLRSMCEGANAFWYLAVILTGTAIYLYKSGGGILFFAVMIIALPIGVAVVIIKRHRIKLFWGQINGDIKVSQL